MAKERILKYESRECKNLEMFCKMLNYSTRNNTFYYIDETYLDYSQDWKWTTIIASRISPPYGGEYQALTPRLWGEVVEADGLKELVDLVDEYFNDQFCLDK